ncbi:unnamed protein product [Fraxinus pennsylvanica]|uniref:Ribosomal protein S21 n=1 Tax=Fraxinus pennsylvanica TaxID=56036 RepID=A0AAD2DJS2_9LAMI|nr:unnamed protein product [Fraxinus pennsylvanica]
MVMEVVFEIFLLSMVYVDLEMLVVDFGGGEVVDLTLLVVAFDKPLLFKRSWNIQILAGVNEPEEKLVGRFRREVLKAGVLQECKRRRFFESTQQKKKRKTREAAKRKRKRRPQSKASVRVKKEDLKKKDDSEDDNWEIFDVDLPYC